MKETWGGHGYLLTNLANGGDPLVIFREPLIHSIVKHVSCGWNLSHYLSFTESKRIAEKYARGINASRLVECDSTSWEALVLSINTGAFFDIKEIEIGLYVASFRGRSPFGHTQDLGYFIMRYLANKEMRCSIVRVLLIDLVRYIFLRQRGNKNFDIAYNNAAIDKEWLILPLDLPNGDPKENAGFTACLDDACIAECKKYQLVHCDQKTSPRRAK